MSSKSLPKLFIGLFAAGLLAYKNPSADAFSHYAESYIRHKINAEGGKQGHSYAEPAVSMIASKFVTASTDRTDLIFLSIFNGHGMGYRWKAIGIAGNFIPISVEKEPAIEDQVKEDQPAPDPDIAIQIPSKEKWNEEHPAAPAPEDLSGARGNFAIPSFDCSKARYLAETLTCSSISLTYQDQLLSMLYKANMALKPLSAQRTRAIKAAQTEWIVARNRCADEQCVDKAYSERIETLLATVLNSQEGNGPLELQQCQLDHVASVGPRLEGDSFKSGIAIRYEKTGGGVSYDFEPELARTIKGDRMLVCLVDEPNDCPTGDDRGKIYFAYNFRTKEGWTLPADQHSCGGA